MNYKVEGSGETLVFIHGLSDSLLYWEFLSSNLRKDYQIIRFDLRGHGESEVGSDEITMDTYVNDLYNLLNGLNIDKANLIGFSLGGAIALDFTIKHLGRVSSLVLMSSFAKADTHLKNILSQFRSALENSFEEFYDLILPMVLCPDVIEENSQELEILKELSSKTANLDALIEAVDVCLDFDVENKLSEINKPALILAGKYDEIATLDIQKNLNENIDDSKLIVFDNVRHNLLVGENNVEVLDILKNFIKK